LTQYAAQAQENEHRKRQKYDGINIEHVSHAFGYRGRSPAGFAYDQVPSIGTAAVAPVIGRINPSGRASRRCFGAIQVSQPDLRRSGRLGQHRALRETPMNVAKWVILAVFALPILELAAFVAVAAAIGFGWALSLILVGSLCGALILRHAGTGHAARIRVAMDNGSFAALQTDLGGGRMLLAGILLLIPGFITDIIALILLIGLRHTFPSAVPRQDDGVVDLTREQWHQVPEPSLPDHRKDERGR
jgi:UPF0716 family protein affecting phage T7 exclusion